MTLPTPAPRNFGLGHPFWATAIQMRQDQESIATIVEQAREQGYLLSYTQISTGLRRAPADLHLPVVTSKAMRRKFEELNKRFDSFQSMRDLADGAIDHLSEIIDELASPDTTPSIRAQLEAIYERWYDRAFDYARLCSDLAVKMHSMSYGAEEKKAGVDANTPDPYAWRAKLVDDFHKSLPPAPNIDLSKVYGSENIRLVGEGGEDGVDEED